MNVLARCILVLAFTFVPSSALPAVEIPAPTLTPNKIAMGAFYNGARLHIEGAAPSGTGVIIVVRGSVRDQFFNRKSRFGPVWLSSDRIHMQHAPLVFLSYSSETVQSMLDREALDQNELDEAAILHRARCFCQCKCNLTKQDRQTADKDKLPSASYRSELEADFLRLKEQEGLYCARPYSVHLTPNSEGGVRYTLDLRWPAKIPPGTYQVEVCVCSRQTVIARSTRTLEVVETGIPGYIQHLSLASPEEYGIDTVLVALIAGFATDLLSTLPGLRRRRTKRDARDQGTKTPQEAHEKEERSHEVESIHFD